MYIPQEFKEIDVSKLMNFMSNHNFATIISNANNLPIASHLPFVIEKRNDEIILSSHIAKANQQWETFLNNELLIIFQGPNAYISPTLYEKPQNVPTWNYISIHAYGKASLISEKDEIIHLMKKTINYFEPSFIKQWETLPENYLNGMINAIVGFEIKVSKLEGQYKLSQNKTKVEQKNIITFLENNSNSSKKAIANEMIKNLNKI